MKTNLIFIAGILCGFCEPSLAVDDPEIVFSGGLFYRHLELKTDRGYENGVFRVIGGEGRGKIERDKHRIEGSLAIGVSYNGRANEPEKLDALHFEKDQYLLLISPSASYKVEVMDHFYLGPGLTLSIPFSLPYLVQKFVVGAAWMGIQIEGSIEIDPRWSIYFSYSRESQWMGKEDSIRSKRGDFSLVYRVD